MKKLNEIGTLKSICPSVLREMSRTIVEFFGGCYMEALATFLGDLYEEDKDEDTEEEKHEKEERNMARLSGEERDTMTRMGIMLDRLERMYITHEMEKKVELVLVLWGALHKYEQDIDRVRVDDRQTVHRLWKKVAKNSWVIAELGMDEWLYRADPLVIRHVHRKMQQYLQVSYLLCCIPKHILKQVLERGIKKASEEQCIEYANWILSMTDKVNEKFKSKHSAGSGNSSGGGGSSSSGVDTLTSSLGVLELIKELTADMPQSLAPFVGKYLQPAFISAVHSKLMEIKDRHFARVLMRYPANRVLKELLKIALTELSALPEVVEVVGDEIVKMVQSDYIPKLDGDSDFMSALEEIIEDVAAKFEDQKQIKKIEEAQLHGDGDRDGENEDDDDDDDDDLDIRGIKDDVLNFVKIALFAAENTIESQKQKTRTTEV